MLGIKKKWGLEELGILRGGGFQVFEAYFIFNFEVFRTYPGIVDDDSVRAIDRYVTQSDKRKLEKSGNKKPNNRKA